MNMPVYISAFTFSLLFAYLVQHSKKQEKQLAKRTLIRKRGVIYIKRRFDTQTMCTFLSFLPLYVVSAIRYMVGTDYAGTYRQIYNYTYLDGYHFKLTGETLYGFLNYIASLYSGSDYVGVFALSSLLVCGFIFAGLKKSENFFYSVLLFIISGYYFWSFNAVRQMIAMSIFVFAFQYIEKEEPGKYFAWILFAFGFHTTALLYLPIYFIRKIKLSPKVLVILSAIFLSSAVLLRNLAFIITSKIAIFNVYTARYFESSKFDSYTESSSIHSVINLLFLILFTVIALLYDKDQSKSNIWITLQFLAFAFASLSKVLPLANRVSRLFAIMQIISIPFMTRLITDKKVRILVNFSIVLCYTIFCFVTYYLLGYHNVFPYQTIFDR